MPSLLTFFPGICPELQSNRYRNHCGDKCPVGESGKEMWRFKNMFGFYYFQRLNSFHTSVSWSTNMFSFKKSPGKNWQPLPHFTLETPSADLPDHLASDSHSLPEPGLGPSLLKALVERAFCFLFRYMSSYKFPVTLERTNQSLRPVLRLALLRTCFWPTPSC